MTSFTLYRSEPIPKRITTKVSTQIHHIYQQDLKEGLQPSM